MTALKSAVQFNEFFEMGLEERYSPFLTPAARRWGVNLMLKSALFALLLLVLAYALRGSSSSFSLLALLGVYFAAGMPALIASIEDLYRLEINIDVLMTLAAFSSVLIGSPYEGGLLLVLFALSGAMEDAVTERAKDAISSLYKLAPDSALVIHEDGEVTKRAVADIQPGTHLLIKAGEVVPLDSRILKGRSSLSFVHLTGESLPQEKKEGDFLPSGALNSDGSLEVEVIAPASESTVQQIIHLVTNAQDAKPKLERWFDKFSKRYASLIIFLTGFFALTLPLLLNIPFLGDNGSIYRAVAFLIAASPCALIIATPIAYLAAISLSAKNGILLKGGATFDALIGCKTIAFDKTGTLTEGELKLIDKELLRDEALEAAMGLERGSTHPIGKAIERAGKERDLAPAIVREFRTHPGLGVEAIANGKRVAVGNLRFILSMLPEEEKMRCESLANSAKKEGVIIALLLLDKSFYLLRFSDEIRQGTEAALNVVKREHNMKLVMLTGDHKLAAEKIGKSLPLDAIYSDLRPEDKLKLVTELAEKEGLIMVGDGINDAPALARATVGISMGKVGSTAAIEASDIVLLHDSLDHLSWLLTLAERLRRTVKENVFLAGAVILLATTPALAGLLPLWLAVVLHEGGTILVGLNALRLLRIKPNLV